MATFKIKTKETKETENEITIPDGIYYIGSPSSANADYGKYWKVKRIRIDKAIVHQIEVLYLETINIIGYHMLHTIFAESIFIILNELVNNIKSERAIYDIEYVLITKAEFFYYLHTTMYNIETKELSIDGTKETILTHNSLTPDSNTHEN